MFGELRRRKSREKCCHHDDAGSSSAGQVPDPAELAVAVISEELAGQSVEAACAVVDLLAPCGQSTPAIERWKRLIVDAAQAREVSVSAANWLLSDHGWTSLQETSVLPDIGMPSVLTEALIREHATFAIYARGLASRGAIE